MKVILVMVSSIDGKITRWIDGDTYTWTSKEDQAHFEGVRDENSLIVMGRATFELARPKPAKGKLRIVLTSQPEKFEKFIVPGQLEFTSEDPKTLVLRLKKQGYKKLLLVGGGGLNTTFFKAGLVDELWLTIEPRIFGKGKMIVGQEDLDVRLQLFSFEKLNHQGTLLLKYQIVKE